MGKRKEGVKDDSKFSEANKQMDTGIVHCEKELWKRPRFRGTDHEFDLEVGGG